MKNQNKTIDDIKSFNQGVSSAVRILRENFFSGNLDCSSDLISKIESLILPIIDNGLFATSEVSESIKEIIIEPKDILSQL